MLNNEFKIRNLTIKNYETPYVIAEAGSNHNQSLEIAYKLIDVAANAGAQAVKFQLFKAEKLYPVGTKLYDIFKSIQLNSDWVPKLAEHSRSCGIDFLASPFDKGSVDQLEEVEVAAYKIASSEMTNTRLLAFIAQKKKPLFLSTGMCDLLDVVDAVELCSSLGAKSIAILQCGAVYPLPPDKANLKVMDVYASMFGCPVGFSDHTLNFGASVAAVARGASIIEKHFTLDKEMEGPDHSYALNPEELKQFVQLVQEAHNSLGSFEKSLLSQEKKFGRREGLYVNKNIKKGARLNDNDVEIKRPALGIRSRHLPKIIDCYLKKDIKKGAPIQWGDLYFDE